MPRYCPERMGTGYTLLTAHRMADAVVIPRRGLEATVGWPHTRMMRDAVHSHLQRVRPCSCP